MDKVKIVVADNHEVVRLGICFILKRTEAFEIVAEAGDCDQLLEQAKQCSPDVIIMDSRLSNGNAIELCGKIKDTYSGIKIIMFISANDEDGIFEAISAGADGLLPKQIKSEELTNAIKMVCEGKSMLDPSITSKVMNRFKQGYTRSEKKETLLNPQERRILAYIAEGKTNKEIAQLLMLSNNTIKNYVSAILSKLNFSNRAEAAAYAVRKNLLLQKAAGDR